MYTCRLPNFLSGGQDVSTLERRGIGHMPLSNKIDKNKELELFSLGFCICNQTQALVLPESSPPICKFV